MILNKMDRGYGRPGHRRRGAVVCSREQSALFSRLRQCKRRGNPLPLWEIALEMERSGLFEPYLVDHLILRLYCAGNKSI